MPLIVQKLRADIQHNILQICFFSRIKNQEIDVGISEENEGQVRYLGKVKRRKAGKGHLECKPSSAEPGEGFWGRNRQPNDQTGPRIGALCAFLAGDKGIG
jgi:hypothetical protein